MIVNIDQPPPAVQNQRRRPSLHAQPLRICTTVFLVLILSTMLLPLILLLHSALVYTMRKAAAEENQQALHHHGSIARKVAVEMLPFKLINSSQKS